MTTLQVNKLGTAEVIVDIVDKGNFEIRPQYAMNPTEITIHNTGNAGRGASAEMHNRYIHNMAGKTPAQTGYASWHYSVDDEAIYQHIPDNETAWHCGDGSGKASGNRNAIGIEICEHIDQKDYAAAEANAIALAVHLMKKHGIPASKVKPHQAYSGKYCPRVILKRDGNFDKFRSRIMEALEDKPTVVQVSNPVVKTTSAAYAGKRLESIYKGKDGVNFYSAASFDDKHKAGVLLEGHGFPAVLAKVTVDGVPMYKVANSKDAIYYVTAYAGYVKLVGGTNPKPAAKAVKPAAVKPKPAAKPAGIKAVGKIKIVNVRNACYVVAKPSVNGDILGTLKVSNIIDISGSVDGWYEVIYGGRRAYVNEKYGRVI